MDFGQQLYYSPYVLFVNTYSPTFRLDNLYLGESLRATVHDI